MFKIFKRKKLKIKENKNGVLTKNDEIIFGMMGYDYKIL